MKRRFSEWGQESISFLLILNAAGVSGRLIPNYISDQYLRSLNTMIPFALLAAISIYAWIYIKDRAGLIAFAVFYGMFSSGLLSLTPSPGKLDERFNMGRSKIGHGHVMFGVCMLDWASNRWCTDPERRWGIYLRTGIRGLGSGFRGSLHHCSEAS